MYPRRLSQSIVSSKPNLKNTIKENFRNLSLINYNVMIRQKLKDLKLINKHIQDFIKNKKIYKLLTIGSQKTKNEAHNILVIWVHHCECVLAQRLRRCQQMFCLYSKWWEERALKEFIKRMRQSVARRGKELALGAAGFSVYNWEENRIPVDEIKKNLSEFDYITQLKENTICMACDPTTRTNINTNICKCGTSGRPSTKTYDEWMLFIEKQDLIVWRRPHPSGQSEYKVFGSYNDVSAWDFLNVQIDTDYRRKWDTTAVILEVAETDPSPESNSDVLYWEMLWPRLFVNRDYVFNRRYLIDKESNTLFIVSKSTEHPKFPKYPEKYRIEDYWSCMVIKPYTDMKEPGIEFSLTYFDNPGVSIPSSVTTWVAMRAMPDFLEKLREATKNYKNYCLKEGFSAACKELIEEERAAAEKMEKEKLDYCSFIRLGESIRLKSFLEPDENETKAQRHGLNAGNFSFESLQNSPDLNNESGEKNIIDSNTVGSDNRQAARSTFWKYLHPLYYFQ